MSINPLPKLLLITFAAALVGGCTTQAWYEGMKQGAVNNCDKQPPGAREDCLNRVNQQRYDDYEKERAAKAGSRN